MPNLTKENIVMGPQPYNWAISLILFKPRTLQPGSELPTCSLTNHPICFTISNIMLFKPPAYIMFLHFKTCTKNNIKEIHYQKTA